MCELNALGLSFPRLRGGNRQWKEVLEPGAQNEPCKGRRGSRGGAVGRTGNRGRGEEGEVEREADRNSPGLGTWRYCRQSLGQDEPCS